MLATQSPATLRYNELIAAFALRPIRSDDHYDAATAVMDSLLVLDRDADEEDYLIVLSLLIEDYDREHHTLPTLTQGGVLRALMDEHGTTQTELAQATGVADSNISAMLADRRGISKRNCKAFGTFFGVPPGRFLV